MKKKVAVIGAGISGLACAYELKKAGFKVDVFESNKYVGGRMASRTKKGFSFDFGANLLFDSYSETKKYCKEFGVSWNKAKFDNHYFLKGNVLIPTSNLVNKFSKARFSIMSYLAGRKNLDFFNLSLSSKYDNTDAFEFTEENAGKSIARSLDLFSTSFLLYGAKDVSRSFFISFLNSFQKDSWVIYKTPTMSSLPDALSKKVTVHKNKKIKNVIAQPDFIKITG